jgi:hypothetical protein
MYPALARTVGIFMTSTKSSPGSMGVSKSRCSGCTAVRVNRYQEAGLARLSTISQEPAKRLALSQQS